MPTGSREFVLHDGAGAGPDVLHAVAGAVSDSMAWANGGPVSTCRRTWLDTFDWRLYRAGLTLEQVTAQGRVELTLTGRDGEVLASERLPAGGKVSWPSLLTALPPGPLRELLEPVAGVRALSPVARAASRVRELRALNADAKTIARLAVDRMSVTYPARGIAPARLTLSPVRGYQGQADRAARLLAGVPGVSAGRGSALDTALAAAGCRPGELAGKARRHLTEPGHAGRHGDGRDPHRAARRRLRRTSLARCATSTPSSCTTCASPSAGPGRR